MTRLLQLPAHWQRALAAVLAVLASYLIGSEAWSAPNARMGVYFDREGTICSGTVQQGVPTEIYIVAHTPPGEEVISGAEFRFVGLPASWTVYPVAEPGTLIIGNPFTDGANVAATMSQCAPQWSTFVMFTVLVLATEQVNDVRLELVKRTVPSNAAFPCPLITDCSGWQMHCVEPTPCLVNMSENTPCDDSATGVETVTFTGVRNLYR